MVFITKVSTTITIIGNTFRPVVKCSITKQIVTDKQSHYTLWFYTGHTFLLLWMGATVFGRSVLSSYSYQRCCYDQRMWESTVFETLRVLSVLLITMFTQMPVAPKHTAATQGLFKLDLNIYWHSRWTSSSDCSASAMGGTLLHGLREPT